MTALIELDRITVSGTPEMGRQQGEALSNRIRDFMAVRFDAVKTYAGERGHTIDRLNDIGRASMGILKEWDLEGYEEHVGIAEGAHVDPVDLYIATNMTDMRDALILSKPGHPSPPDAEGCSAILVPASKTADGLSIAGQTWDLNPPDIEYVVAIHRRPKTGPATWTVTCAGCQTLMGLNQNGLALGTTNIKTYGSRPGVGYLSLLHRMVRAHSTREAATILKTAPRSGAHVYWLADPVELREYETSPDHVARRAADTQPVCHTNHCLDATHQAIEGEQPSDSSQCRLNRMETMLERNDHTVETIKEIFADRSDGLNSINRYAEDDQGTATNAVFIATPGRREAWTCRGPADRGQWYKLGF